MELTVQYIKENLLNEREKNIHGYIKRHEQEYWKRNHIKQEFNWADQQQINTSALSKQQKLCRCGCGRPETVSHPVTITQNFHHSSYSYKSPSSSLSSPSSASSPIKHGIDSILLEKCKRV